MSAAQHTSGPWKAFIPPGEGHQPFITTSDGGDPLDAGTLEGGNGAAEANARLIAAAPELFEALAVIIANAGLIPDPATGESTDCYAVPIDDIEAAIVAFNKARDQ